MSGLTNEQWKRIFNGVADRAPEIFKDCDLQFSISVRNEDGTEETIYEHEGKKDDSESDNWLVFLNDTVEHEGSEFQVVAMSHRNKVVIRPKDQTYGGKWVKAGSVRVTRHVLGVR